MTALGLCVGLETPTSDWPAQDSLNELSALAKTAGIDVVDCVHQNRRTPNQLSYVGKGKLQDIATMVREQSIDIAIFDDELSPMQQRHIENELAIKILDRTSLVLDIFSQRAQTKEAQIQIELAQLQYLQPRLRRMWTHLSRLGGGVGTRGPGETQLEVDRRQIGRRIQKLKTDLDKVRRTRDTQRKKRHTTPTITVAIMGYTNAGKSTLHHTLTGSNVRQEDQLFATLDPTTRLLRLPSNDTVMITDTVGFIRKLPHSLVSAFKATLEEVSHADLILHVIDCSNPRWRDLMATSNQVLDQLGIQIKNELVVFNKIDCATDPVLTRHDAKSISNTFINATQMSAQSTIIKKIDDYVSQFKKTMTFTIPYNKMKILDVLHRQATVLSTENNDEGITVHCQIGSVLAAKVMTELHENTA